MAIVLTHEDTVFEDQVVYLGGHAYFDCTFRRCTMVLCGFDGVMTGCEIIACVWHLDFSVSDHTQWDSFMEKIAPAIGASLPRGVPKRKK